MKKNVLVLTFLLAAAFTFGQMNYQRPSVKKANRAYYSGSYFAASELLVGAYNKISPNNDRAIKTKSALAYKAGYSFAKAFNTDKAIEWFQRAIDLRYFKEKPQVYFRLANQYKIKGNYEKAKENYKAYLKLKPNDKQAKNAISSLNKAEVMKDNRTRYTIKNESKINSIGIDMAPAIAGRRGNAIVFGSTRPAPTSSGTDPITGEGYFNIWEVEKTRSGNWKPPHLFEAEGVNSEYNEGTLIYDGRFRHIFFTRCPRIEDKELGCQIWTAEKKGRSFSEPKMIPLAPRDSFSVGHPCPNMDGTALIFASDMPGGFGGKDLWYSEYQRRSDMWSKPVNLGPEINTPGNELFPTFGINGDLYFASNGHGGLGGLDIYRADTTDSPMKFKNPVNLGIPVNSDADDYSLIELNEDEGFFTSNRDGVKGNNHLGDIYSYVLPPNIFDLKVIVSEIGNNNPIEGATVKVTPKEGTAFTGVTNASGVVYWDKKPDGSRYIIEKSNYSIQIMPLEGYHVSNKVEEFTTKGLKYNQNFILEMGLIAKTPIVLPEVRYAYNSAELQVIPGEINSKDSLNFVYRLLQEYPGMVLKLLAHTDSRGSDSYNLKLSKERAESCVRYLVEEKGVDSARLIPVGRGETDPRIVYLQDSIYQAEKPSGEYQAVELTTEYIDQFEKSDNALFLKLHQMNRRTEGEVVRMDYNPEEAKKKAEKTKAEQEKKEETEKAEDNQKQE